MEAARHLGLASTRVAGVSCERGRFELRARRLQVGGREDRPPLDALQLEDEVVGAVLVHGRAGALAWCLKVEHPQFWRGLSQAAEATGSVQAAEAAL